jgi:hypothetical protein
MEFECETLLVAKTPETRQQFSFLCEWFPGFYLMRERMASFFLNLGTRGPSREGERATPRPQMVTALLLFCGETSQQFMAIAAAIINRGYFLSLNTIPRPRPDSL